MKVKSSNELAAIFGVKPSTCRGWIGQGAPAKTDGGYDVGEWVRWARGRGVGGLGNDADSLEADRQYKIARAEREKLRLARERCTVVSVEEHGAVVMEVIRAFIDGIDSAPVEFAVSLPGKSGPQIKALVRDWFNQMRRSISEKLYHEKQENHQSEVHQATQENQPVGDGDEVGRAVEINVLGGNGKTTAKGASSNGRALARRDSSNLRVANLENCEGLRARG